MLHRIAGDLHIEQVSLEEIAAQHGTPTYVYSESAIQQAYIDFETSLEGQSHAICYAVKANSNIAILQILVELGAGFDIVSGGELKRVLAAGGSAEKTVFSGVGKQNWEIQLALEANIRCFNVESASELRRISHIASTCNKVAPVSIRINPDVDPKTHPYISTGLKENKFGISADEAKTLYRIAAADPYLQTIGIDCHIGSQITDLAPYIDALTRLLALVKELELEGIFLKHIDLGGGFGVRYRQEEPIRLSSFAAAIREIMIGYAHQLIFEPGRLMVANAGLLITRVTALKQNESKQFAIVDAAMNDLIRPSLYDAWHAVTSVSKRDNPSSHWDIVGPICETGDFIAKNRELSIEEDDLLAILSAGAYGFVMSSNYNSRNRAAEILVKNDECFVIRRRETIEDQLALELPLNR